MDTLILGLVLAGGRSSRMGREKSFVPLQGQPLLAHVLHRLSPQVGRLAINANGDPARFARFGCPVIPDLPGFKDAGPLCGILAGLRHAAKINATHMATLPCDAPFAPMDLVARLMSGPRPNQVAMAVGPHGLEPAFALWPVAGLTSLEVLVGRGEDSLRRAAAALGEIAEIEFQTDGEGPDPFVNLNQPEDIAAAESHLTKC